MKTPYLDAEIEKLLLIAKGNAPTLLIEKHLEKLDEFKAIKQALSLSDVEQRFSQLPESYKRFAELAYKYTCEGCTDDEHEEFEEIRMDIGY